METTSKFFGTKSSKRGGHPKVRERIHLRGRPLRRRIFLFTVFTLILLLLGKVFISGLYLRMGSTVFSSSNVAIAEEGVDAGLTIETKERMLKKKEQDLKEWEERLNKKEKNLMPLQKEIDTKFEELNALQTTLTAYAKQLAEREKALNDAKMSHLVELYSAMEPAQAAVIMQQLNLETVVRILGNMRGKIAGKIVAMMDPAKGATISEKLSQLE